MPARGRLERDNRKIDVNVAVSYALDEWLGVWGPVLCQNSIHLERYKRAVDAAWTVGVRSKYSCGFPMVET